jgi:hypothetical protein
MLERYCVEAAVAPGGSGTVYFTPPDQKIQGRLGREITHGFYCTGTISVVRLPSLACTAPCGDISKRSSALCSKEEVHEKQARVKAGDALIADNQQRFCGLQL